MDGKKITFFLALSEGGTKEVSFSLEGAGLALIQALGSDAARYRDHYRTYSDKKKLGIEAMTECPSKMNYASCVLQVERCAKQSKNRQEMALCLR